MDPAYSEDLFSHMKSIDVLHHECNGYDMGSIIAVLFKADSGVEKLMYYKDEDYTGIATVVYTYKGKYFCLKEEFGSCSGCDDWESNTLENHVRIVEGFKKDIVASLVDNIYEVTLPFESYNHPDVRNEWEKVLKQQGDGVYDKCVALADELLKQREEERDRKRAEYEAGEGKALMERLLKEKEYLRAQRQKRDAEILQDVTDAIVYLENNTSDTDPFYNKKKPFKVKLLKYYLKHLDVDSKTRAESVLEKFQ